MCTHTHSYICKRQRYCSIAMENIGSGMHLRRHRSDEHLLAIRSSLIESCPFPLILFSFHFSSCASWNNTDLRLSTDHLWGYPACMVPQGTSRKFKTPHQSDTIVGVTSKMNYSWLYIVLSLFTEHLHAYTLSSKIFILYYLMNDFNCEVICLMSAVIYSMLFCIFFSKVCVLCLADLKVQ